MATNPFAEFVAEPEQENPFATFVTQQPLNAPKGEKTSLGQLLQSAVSLGRSTASLADVTIGGVLPAAAQMVGYPLARLGRSPEEAQAATQRLVSAVDKPFGKMAGVTETPEYQQEAGRQIMDFIGENFQKGAKWIADKTGLPTSDVESYMASLSLAAPAIAKPVARTIQELAAPALEKAVIGAKMPFEPIMQARRERMSLEDYARGPQIDAATEAQRLGIALSPENIQPTLGPKTLSAIAGQKGTDAIANANKNQIRKVALNELGLPETTQLDSKTPFNEARMRVAEPYNLVRKLPTMTADESLLSSLNKLRPDEAVIGSERYAKGINAIIDDAVAKTTNGLTGAEVLKNVQTLRQRAQKTYNNKSADLASLDVADTNLAIANALESMIETNIFNPKLLTQFRDARQKMAKTYAYEAATDFNTGMIDVNKLSRVTAKDNAMTGDIAALGKIAGNFPEAFTTKATESMLSAPRITRSGIGGAGGALLGAQLGGVTGSIIGTAAGALAGEGAGLLAARRISSPEYQAGLSLRDARIPVNQIATAAQPIPQSQAIVPYQAPVEVLGKGEGPYQPNFTIPMGQVREQPLPTSSIVRELPAPSPQSTLSGLRAEDVRRAGMSRTLGQQAEAQQAALEAASRQPTRGAVELQINPLTGVPEISTGVRGATPSTFQDFGTSLQSATNKAALGRTFDFTAAEKVAFDKTRIDLAEVVPGMKSLSDKTIATRIQDREWVQDAITKARDKAVAFEQIAARAKTRDAQQQAIANRERMLDLAEQMENTLRIARPDVSGKIQGAKTRAAFREGLLTNPQPPFKMEIRGTNRLLSGD
ncbi:hypothetical protein CCP3SC1AL1_190027 [Gammaproteobacteria bacterium]